MQNFTDKMLAAGLENRLFTENQLASVLGGSDARRYGIVSRAIKNGTLTRVRRGLYFLNSPHTSSTPHPFVIAQAIKPMSYISFETALSYHQWIPEAVFTTASVTPARKKLITEHDSLGLFSFNPLAVNQYHYLCSVLRTELNQRIALVATPLRALMDLVAFRKQRWVGIEWIEQGLRIERWRLNSLSHHDFDELSGVYKHKTARDFLENLKLEVIDNQ